MGTALRGFVTPWARWVERWCDHRMQPAKSPLWVADMGHDGAYVGPYVDPQGRVRDEVTFYPKLELAERELNLRGTDFAPWRTWLRASLVAAVGSKTAYGDMPKYERELGARIESALVHLRVKGGGKAYIREIIPAGIDLVTTIGKLRGAPPEVPAEFQAKIAERDRFVDASAREQLGRLTGKARGAS